MLVAGAASPATGGRSFGSLYVPREGFQAVGANAGDSPGPVTCSSWADASELSEETSESWSGDGSSDSSRHLPQAFSVFVELKEEWSQWRSCWCLLAMRHPRTFLRTSTGRVLLLRCIGMMMLVTTVVVMVELRLKDQITATMAYRAVGSCIGMMPGLIRVPEGSLGTHPKRSRQVALAVGILVISVVVLLDPLRHQDVWDDGDNKDLFAYLTNVVSMCLMMPLAIVTVMMRHPPSPYFRDAIWCVVGFWAMMVFWLLGSLFRLYARKDDAESGIHRHGGPQVQYLFWTASLNFEGVVFAWVARLMASRIQALESLGTDISFLSRYSTPIILVMSAAFHVKMCCEMLIEKTDWEWKELYTVLTVVFLGIWLLYSGMLTSLLVRGVRLMWAEAGITEYAPKAEAKWAANILGIEILACLTLTFTTLGNWMIKLIYMLAKDEDVPYPKQSNFTKELLKSVMVAHKMDYVINAFSIAVLSGLIWQPSMPRVEGSRSDRSIESADAAGEASPAHGRPETISQQTVRELAHRGFRLCDLIDFWETLLSKKVMPEFDPAYSTTNDVVRQAIIPMSRNAGPDGGGSAMASIWNSQHPESKDGRLAKCMVTHNWSNLFWHLVAAIVADQLGVNTYAEVAQDMLKRRRLKRVRQALASKGALEMTYWVCAFSVNQHASICDGFGAPPNEVDPDRQRLKLAEYEAKKRDTVTGEEFRVCDCRQEKYRNASPEKCEMNKFDDMMRLLKKMQTGAHGTDFSHLIAVDAGFEAFGRAWCVAEIVESYRSQIPQRMKIHSQESLDQNYNRLLRLDVNDCDASIAADKEMILNKIGKDNVKAFNARLTWAVFGTEGLFSKWYDGQQLASLVGRILQRAKSAAEEHSGRAQRDADTNGFSRMRSERGCQRCRTSSSQSSFRWLQSLRNSVSWRSHSRGLHGSETTDTSTDEDTQGADGA